MRTNDAEIFHFKVINNSNKSIKLSKSFLFFKVKLTDASGNNIFPNKFITPNKTLNDIVFIDANSEVDFEIKSESLMKYKLEQGKLYYLYLTYTDPNKKHRKRDEVLMNRLQFITCDH